MKIAHLTSRLCRESAGLGVAVASISESTRSFAEEVHVFGVSSPAWQAGDSRVWTGAPVTVLEPTHWSGPFGYAPGMLQALRAFQPDIIHVHGLWTYSSIAALRWRAETGRPYILSAHGMLFGPSLASKPVRKRIARFAYQDLVLQTAVLLHATSPDEEVSYKEQDFGNAIEVIPLSIPHVPRPPVDDHGPRRRATFVGRLHHQKGLDWLIEAWLNLERDFPDWELSIVGPQDDTYLSELAALRQRSESRRVSFVGPLYGEAKYRYMAGSELCLMPSRSENFGLVAAESLMMEVPVIATKGTPWSGLVSSGAGWWCDPGSQGLEFAMRQAMGMSRQQLREKGELGRRWVECEFSQAVISERWRHAYERSKAQWLAR